MWRRYLKKASAQRHKGTVRKGDSYGTNHDTTSVQTDTIDGRDRSKEGDKHGDGIKTATT